MSHERAANLRICQEAMMASKAGGILGGYLTPWDKFVFGVNVGQRYLMENTTLGIPALIQSEGTVFSTHPSYA